MSENKSGRWSARCAREGCKRKARKGKTHCSFLCVLIEEQINQAQRIHTAVGATPQTTELWALVVGMSDALTDVQRIHYELHNAAKETGMTSQQWFAVVDGR